VVSGIINSTDCIVPLEVIAETVYTMERKINIPRAEIAELIQEFIGIRENMVQEENVVRFACNLFASSNFDFVDCILYGYSRAKGNLVLTFDSDLKRQLQNKAYNESGCSN
jgi:predicted nucleic-acid-binding protein